MAIASSDQIHIGMELDTASPSDFWAGSMDELAVYRRALSAEEVAAHFAADVEGYPTSVLASDPLAYWRFNETAGDNLRDERGNYPATGNR